MYDRNQLKMQEIMNDYLRHRKAGRTHQARLKFSKIRQAAFLSPDSVQQAFDALDIVEDTISQQLQLARVSEELAYYLKKKDVEKHRIDFEREADLVHALRVILATTVGKNIQNKVNRLDAREADIRAHIKEDKKYSQSAFSHNTFSDQKSIKKEVFGGARIAHKQHPIFEQILSVFSTERKILFWRKKTAAFNSTNYFNEMDRMLKTVIEREKKLFPGVEITAVNHVGILADALIRYFSKKTTRELKELHSNISNGPAGDFFAALEFYRNNSETFRSINDFPYQEKSIGMFFLDMHEKSNAFQSAFENELRVRGLFKKGDALYKEIKHESQISIANRDFFRQRVSEKNIQEIDEQGWTPIHVGRP